MLTTTSASFIDSNDHKFLEYMYLHYSRLMCSEITKIIGETPATEDIIQEALIRFADKIPLLQSLDETRRINYVITTARNMAKNYLRSQCGVTFCSLDCDSCMANKISDGINTEDIIMMYYDHEQFEHSWKKLDITSKILLEGKYILGKSDAEIAETLGTKPSSVRMMLSRARKKALKLMSEP